MKLRIALILSVVLLLASLSLPVYAQETTAEPTTASAEVQPEQHPVAGVAEEEPQSIGNGVTTLVLLIGLAAIGGIVVYRVWMGKSSAQPGT